MWCSFFQRSLANAGWELPGSRRCHGKPPASCGPQGKEGDAHGGACFSSVVSFFWASSCRLAVAPGHTRGYDLSGRDRGLRVSPPPQRGQLQAGVKPATPSSGFSLFSFLSISCYSLVSSSLVDLVISHRFLINFADQGLYFWSVSSLATAMFSFIVRFKCCQHLVKKQALLR